MGPVRVRLEQRPTEMAITVVNEMVRSPLHAPLPESGYGVVNGS